MVIRSIIMRVVRGGVKPIGKAQTSTFGLIGSRTRPQHSIMQRCLMPDFRRTIRHQEGRDHFQEGLRNAGFH